MPYTGALLQDTITSCLDADAGVACFLHWIPLVGQERDCLHLVQDHMNLLEVRLSSNQEEMRGQGDVIDRLKQQIELLAAESRTQEVHAPC